MNVFNRTRRPGFFGGSTGLFPPVIKWLLILNIGIFLLDKLVLTSTGIGALWPIQSGNFYPWQIISYMFLHGGFTHLFFNMFALWMFGMELETTWGSKKFLVYYFLCGVGAAVANLFIAPLFSAAAPTIGASGAVFGVLAAFGFLFPDREIYLYFIIGIKAKYFVIFYMALELFFTISGTSEGIAHVAHLGGAITGLIYLLINKKQNRLWSQDTGITFTPPVRSKMKLAEKESTHIKDAVYREPENTDMADYRKEQEEQARLAQDKIDAILDKLNEGGYQSLTEEEKRILFQESKKLR